VIDAKPSAGPIAPVSPGALGPSVREAVAECRRDIEEAAAALEKFKADWFRENPPRPGEAREDASGIELAAMQLQRAARDLLRLTSPTPK
jgi:hypothetical protein